MVEQVKITLYDDHATLEMNAEVTEGLALAIEAGLEKLFNYYQYERIILRVNSPGGPLSALRHILEYMQVWRDKGLKIETEVTFCAASAAAVLLSFGEVGTRTVHKHSTVLYHHSRIGGNASVITASGANYLATLLKSTDQSIVTRLVSHIASGNGGIQKFCHQGSLRCEMLSSNSMDIAQQLELNAGPIALRWLKQTTTMYRDVGKKKSLDVYRRHLSKRMDEDSAMDLREAYALCLIDSVHGVPALSIRTEPKPLTAECAMHVLTPSI